MANPFKTGHNRFKPTLSVTLSCLCCSTNGNGRTLKRYFILRAMEMNDTNEQVNELSPVPDASYYVCWFTAIVIAPAVHQDCHALQ